MSKQLDDLKAAVAANTAATQAAVTKIGTLEDPAALQPLTDAVNASATALNAAIAPPAPAI